MLPERRLTARGSLGFHSASEVHLGGGGSEKTCHPPCLFILGAGFTDVIILDDTAQHYPVGKAKPGKKVRPSRFSRQINTDLRFRRLVNRYFPDGGVRTCRQGSCFSGEMYYFLGGIDKIVGDTSQLPEKLTCPVRCSRGYDLFRGMLPVSADVFCP